MEDQWFVLAGEQNGKEVWAEEKEICRGKRPVAALSVLALLVLGCLFCRMFIPKDPSYMDLQNCSVPPGKEFWFGTDAMGRDLFSMIWYGGRISLFIGFASAGISTAIAILFGSASGLAPRWLDGLLMRFAEILLSVPELLLVVLIQAALGSANILTISLCVGITGWETMAKVIRGFIIASVEDSVDQAVGLGLLSAHPVIPLGIRRDHFYIFPRILRKHSV